MHETNRLWWELFTGYSSKWTILVLLMLLDFGFKLGHAKSQTGDTAAKKRKKELVNSMFQAPIVYFNRRTGRKPKV